ncbi:pilus assembly protein TadG-related protein [Lichenihabitans sp. Uapishka_5]|uniref:pilus assembly protein TadG-related protein n=1 Tax=Lichenihabitans sp. Uapishka_5 TaxID=3037302 RepID=UPI0029E81BE9|nr:pilus assembly protein TadG-related protein [Lichenihabitans sp. Uapishka_5]MDX7951046.1 pilus assembly protein TadG-related protein [Lichenihabitans sp. Uapishka_5]
MRAWPGLTRRFFGGRGGNVAVIFAIAMMPLMAFTGVAIDYGLITRLQVKLQAATDATALALCKTDLGTSTATLQAKAVLMMAEYMAGDKRVAAQPLTVTAGPPRKISLTTQAGVDALFSSFVGKPQLDTVATAQCGTPAPKTFEIALVLDTTGSMKNSGGGTTKIAALQAAASNFVDYIKSSKAFASNSRISVTPFAVTVKLDPTAYAAMPWVDSNGLSPSHWTNVDKQQAAAAGFTSRFSIFSALQKAKSTWGWGGCFESLAYPLDTQDGAPTSNSTLYVPMFSPDEPGGVGSGSFQQGSTSYDVNNSYLADSNGASGCDAPTDFMAAEKQACKYVAPKVTSSTSIGPNKQCITQPLQRLTGDSTTLKTLINSLQASGNTNIHEGLIWGWRTLSPISVFADGAPYASTTTSKILILMTDGTNAWDLLNSPNKSNYFPGGYLTNADGSSALAGFPSSYASSTSTTQLRNAIDQITAETCTNIKASGISVYTIGFSVSSDPIDKQGISLLQSCATTSSQAYIANNSTDLMSAFDQIAKSIGSLRLTQ